jgi:hypothetical protein
MLPPLSGQEHGGSRFVQMAVNFYQGARCHIPEVSILPGVWRLAAFLSSCGPQIDPRPLRLVFELDKVLGLLGHGFAPGTLAFPCQ